MNESPVAVVTGGSRGIGRGIAAALVARGDRVCVTGRNAADLDAAVTALGGPGRAMGVAGRAHDEAHQTEVIERVMDTWGRVDHLVNNAGTNPVFGPLADLDPGVLAKVFETNVLSAFGFARRTWAAWQREHGGSIVNIASVAGLTASPMIGAYGVSKAALISLTQQLAHEFAPGVRVNALAPAVVRTRFAAALYEGREEEAAAPYPLGRLGLPEDVAGAAAFLASDAAGWITGQTLTVDGGLSLNGGLG